jgi:hypothetical protein
MKKKYRDITVNNVKYAWMVQSDILTIWCDKKIIANRDVTHIIATPGFVREVIEKING